MRHKLRQNHLSVPFSAERSHSGMKNLFPNGYFHSPEPVDDPAHPHILRRSRVFCIPLQAGAAKAAYSELKAEYAETYLAQPVKKF
jgi:hypothetical protein